MLMDLLSLSMKLDGCDMPSLVLELQAMATDSSNDVIDLLRKALLVSSKLEIEDFAKWVHSELDGYEVSEIVPAYRVIRTDLKVWNPYNGYIPLHLNSDLENKLCNIHLRAPISQVVTSIRKEDGYPTIPFAPEQREYLLDIQESPAMEPVRRVSITCMKAIEDAIRNTILDWSLKLEKQGVLGDGMSFTHEEKQKAKSHQVHIENFQGVLGDVSGNVTQKNKIKVAKKDFLSLKAALEETGVGENDIVLLEKAIEADGEPSAKGEYGEKVQGWVGKMIGKAASGGWAIAMGAAGELLGKALSAYYGW